MDGARTLIVFYSRKGTTRQVARRMAGFAHGDVEELVDLHERRGLSGFLKSSLDATLGHTVNFAPTRHDPAMYDVVVIGTPILNGAISAPVRSYLLANRGRLDRVAFFCTDAGSGSARALRQMESLCNKAPLVSLVLRTPDIESGNFEAKARSFVGELQRRMTGASSSSLPPSPSSSSLPRSPSSLPRSPSSLPRSPSSPSLPSSLRQRASAT